MPHRGVSPIVAEVLMVAVAVAAAVFVYAYVLNLTATTGKSAPVVRPITIDTAAYTGGVLKVWVRGTGSLQSPMLYLYSKGRLIAALTPSTSCSSDLCTLEANVFIPPGSYVLYLKYDDTTASTPLDVSETGTLSCNSCDSCTDALKYAANASSSSGTAVTVVLQSDLYSKDAPCISFSGPSSAQVVFNLNGHRIHADQSGGATLEVNNVHLVLEHGTVETGDTPCTSAISVFGGALSAIDLNAFSGCGEGSASIHATDANVFFDLLEYNTVLCDSSYTALSLNESNASCACGSGKLYLDSPNTPDVSCECAVSNNDVTSCGGASSDTGSPEGGTAG